jgi:hypothetical protein
MLINDDDTLQDLACFSKSPTACEKISRKVNVWKYDTHVSPVLMWAKKV